MEKDIELSCNNLYKLTAWIVDPNSTYDKYGNVKLLKTNKSIKDLC